MFDAKPVEARGFIPEWTRGYGMAVATAVLFFCLSFLTYSYGSVAPQVSGALALGYAILIALSTIVMILGGGGMAALPFFLLGTGLFFGAGTYFSTSVTGSNKYFSEGQQWQLLPQVNMVNATAILCVVLAAGALAAVRPRSEAPVPSLNERLEVMRPLLWATLAAGYFVTGVGWLTFPRISVGVVNSIMPILEGIPVFAIFLGCALWSTISKTIRVLIVLLVLAISVEGMLSARKLTAMMPFLAASMGLWVSERNRIVAVILAALTIWIYVAMLATFVPQVRAHVIYDPINNTIAERATIVSDVVQMMDEMEVDERHEGTLARFSPTQFSAHFISSYDNNYPGETLDKVLVVLVPRVLWPDKPIINPGKEFDTVWRDWDIFSSLAIGFPAEAYWNDGWAGVVAVSLYIGLMLGWFSRKWFLFRRDGWAHGGIFILSPLIVKSALWVESNIVGAYVGGWIKFALMIMAIDLSIRTFLFLRERFLEDLEDHLTVDFRPRPV